ncbi:hypothetical protein ACT54M_16415 [Leptospira santarosai]|uniref:hypothetical protein n=1 Tax=Leptospira santarosai TaxID=28183 RepID=UPI0009660713|nr:hypothetical protein [Leptospira santarosai]OLY59367.1 hypothetical protein BV917_15365 [Leptospira santarosai serovar Guaricura]
MICRKRAISYKNLIYRSLSLDFIEILIRKINKPQSFGIDSKMKYSASPRGVFWNVPIRTQIPIFKRW